MDRIVVDNKGDLIFEDIEMGIKPSPRYTLDGLYSILPNEKMNTRIKALRGALQQHANYQLESIAKRKETRLKLFENAYRRKVSGQ